MVKRKLNGRQKGYMLAVTTMSAFALIGFVGLAFDAGQLQIQRTRMQMAADAAAVAGAFEVSAGSSAGTVTTAGQRAAELNGVLSGGFTTVSVQQTPNSGYYSGNSSWTQALITNSKATTYFMGMFTGNNGSSVSARSVAKIGTPGPACLVTLSPTDTCSLQITPNQTTTVTGCGAHVNSAQSNALYVIGNSGQVNLNLSSLTVHGNTYNSGSYAYSTTPTNGAGTVGDPLAYKAVPTPASCTSTWYSASGNATLNPGTYCGGITLSGNSSNNVTFNPGTYVLLGGGLNIPNGANLTGNGVTFYNTYNNTYGFGAINVHATNADLRAPKSGTYEALLFASNPGGSTSLNYVFSTGGRGVEGAIYLPHQDLIAGGATSQTPDYTILVADSIEFQADYNLTSNYSNLASGNPMRVPTPVIGE